MNRPIFLNFFASEEALHGALSELSSTHASRLAMVSLEVPLLSNLPVWGNIALIRQYHDGLSVREARQEALSLLKRFDLEGIAERRNPSLTSDERFLAMLLRAAAVQDAVLVLDRPFQILTGLHDGRFIREALERIEDLIAEAHIFDYTPEKRRYWTPDDPEN